MTDEYRRVYSTTGDRLQLVTYRCRHCEKRTDVTVPDSPRFRVYRYGVCAKCAVNKYAAEHGLKVMNVEPGRMVH